jgi:hypothetical protein
VPTVGPPRPDPHGALGRHVVTVTEREAFAARVACLEEEAARPSPAAPAVTDRAATREETPRTASAPHPSPTDTGAVPESP